MDQESLVREDVAAGRRFLERFVAAGHSIFAAAWIQRDDEASEPPSLYMATELYDREGPLAAYKAVVACAGDMDDELERGSRVTVVSPRNQIARDIALLPKLHPERPGYSLRTNRIGSLDDVKQVFIYNPWVFAANPPGSMTAEDVGRELFRLLQRGAGPQPTSRVTLKDGTGFEGRPLALFAGDQDSMRVQFVESPDLAVRDLKLGEIAAIR